jgi:hypothetical protein
MVLMFQYILFFLLFYPCYRIIFVKIGVSFIHHNSLIQLYTAEPSLLSMLILIQGEKYICTGKCRHEHVVRENVGESKIYWSLFDSII